MVQFGANEPAFIRVGTHDVVFGATIGVLAGRAVSRHGRPPKWALVPAAVPKGVGILLVKVR